MIYYKDTADQVVYVLDDLTGDPNGDGKIDVRDLRLAKENVFGDSDVKKAAADINQDDVVNTADVDVYRDAIFGTDPRMTHSVGADGCCWTTATRSVGSTRRTAPCIWNIRPAASPSPATFPAMCISTFLWMTTPPVTTP